MAILSPTNLDLDPTTFVGRVEAIAQLVDAIERSSLVTVLGPPGTGKTRLAREVARRVHERFEGGVWFVDLTASRRAADLCTALANVLGIRLAGDDDPVGHLAHAVAGHGAVLIVLDNFEQLAEEAAEAIGKWVARAPRARFVATSRERLRIPAERVFDLPPLELPPPEPGRPSSDIPPPITAEEALQSEAVQLLIHRSGGFELTDADAARAVHLVRALDGIPLAIELAAARLPMMGLDELDERMNRRLDLLSRGPRGAEPRQATLRGALDWSWDLLDDDEREALASASLFRGGFGLDAAEAVLAAATRDATDLLQSLHDKSLVHVTRRTGHAARSARGGATFSRTRYRLLESVREWASEKREELGLDAAQTRYARHYVDRGRLRRTEAQGREPEAALEWLAVELDNLVHALEIVTTDVTMDAPDRIAARASLALAAEPVLAHRGPHELRLRLLAGLCGDPTFDLLVPADRAMVRQAFGRALAAGGRMDEALHAFTVAEDDAASAPALVADILADRGRVEQTQGRLDDARLTFERARDRIEGVNAPRARAAVLGGLGLLHHSRGALDAALASYEEALVEARRGGDRTAEATLRAYLGSLRLQQGRDEEAREEYMRAVAIYEALTDGAALGLVEGNLAILAQARGDWSVAADHFARGLTAARHVGDRMIEAHLLGYRGGLAHEQADLEVALEHYHEAIEILRELGDARLEGVFRAAAAAADATRGRAAAAVDGFAAAERALEGVGDPGLIFTVAIHRGHLALAAGDAGGRAAAERTLETARENEALLAQSDDARFAVRVLTRALSARALVVYDGGARVQPPDGDLVDLESRAPLRRIVARLVEERVARPGAALDVEAILDAGWPGERVTYQAGLNRVKVALSTLRKLGFREVLQRSEEGYRFDPEVPVVER